MAVLRLKRILELDEAFNFGAPPKQEYLIQMAYVASEASDDHIRGILKKYCKRYKLVNMKNTGGQQMEAFYQVVYRRKFKSANLIRELKELEDVINVNLFFDQDDADPVF